MSDVVARFEVRYSQFLDPHGNMTRPLPAFAQDAQALLPLYRAMTLNRAFDARCVALQRTGQLGTYASTLGKEAIESGVGSAMRPEDVLLLTYREAGIQLWRGVTMLELLLYWAGDERGSDYAVPRKDFPVCITIASQCVHAAGAAYAMKLRGEPRVAVCMVGDGATSKGEFYEAINAAGVWQLPLVFVITNNQYAISVPRRVQSAAQTLAQKAVAAGIDGQQVDGNDVIAMRDAIDRALAKARSGGGPSVIEALSYRLSDHTTADDASRYRSAEEVTEAWVREPLARLRHHLLAAGVWSKADEEKLLHESSEQVQRAVQAYLDTPRPPPEFMFDHLYATLPAALDPQRAQALAAERRRG